MNRPIPRLSQLIRKKPFPVPPRGPPLPPDILIDEEISPSYNSKSFYPAKPGEVLADRYQTVVKVGWGVSLTVWLARDLQAHIDEPESIMALKITNNTDSAGREREVEEHIAKADPSHRGRSLMRTFLDAFEVQAPAGSHACLVYPAMREPLSRTVHTDLKLENIMNLFEDPTVHADFMDFQLANPMASKTDSTGRTVYQSCSDFGPLKNLRSIPQLVDFGLALRLEEDNDWGVYPIQADHYQAPELWKIIEGKQLFRHIHDQEGRYDAKLHIAETIALLGPPPPQIIQRYHYMQEYLWPEPARREYGRLCQTADEYFDGPFFHNNDIGRFLYPDLIPDRKLGDTVSFLEGEERESFLHLVKRMLVWHPDVRKTAGQLAEHPFLQPKQQRDDPDR
ncbi:kinase-like protein [Aspergillus aurantiobrunneus]